MAREGPIPPHQPSSGAPNALCKRLAVLLTVLAGVLAAWAPIPGSVPECRSQPAQVETAEAGRATAVMLPEAPQAHAPAAPHKQLETDEGTAE